MKSKIIVDIEKLQNRIESGNYLQDIDMIKEWGGADVMISNQMTKSIQEWSGKQPFTISFQQTIPKKRVVITPHSKELSWLFYQLRDIFRGKIDNISKYDFYGLLAQSAIDYSESHKNRQDCTELLSIVNGKAKEYYYNEIAQ
jgi:hypothetical protein